MAVKLAPMPIAFKPGAPATIKMVPQSPCAARGRSGPLIVMVAQNPAAAWVGWLFTTTVVCGAGFAYTTAVCCCG
jgi:hypothetical protein